jgi:hypothetical protein
MRALLLLAVAAPLLAQAPVDSTPAPRSSPVYLTLLLEGHGGRLITGEGGSGDESRQGLNGADFSIQSSRKAGVGLALRSLSGPYDYADLSLLLGSRRFSVDIGAASRTGYSTFTDELNDTTYSFARVGFRSRANLGNTDFSVTMRVLGYVRIPTPEEEALASELEGFSAETGLAWTYTKWGVPWTAQLGYRLERFVVFGVEQETSSLGVGVGVLLGRR